MSVQVQDVGCFGFSGVHIPHVAHEGLLIYQDKKETWKERWFLLDSVKSALIKCNVVNHQPSGSYGSILGGKNVLIADAQPISQLQTAGNGAEGDKEVRFGFSVTTRRGATIVFRTKSLDEQLIWLKAINKTSGGFISGVANRLAERDVLAGKYTLVRELGRGASGIVSLYTWQGKPYAIKKLIPQKSKGVPNRKAVSLGTERQPVVHTSQGKEIPHDVRREIALLKKVSRLPYVIHLHDVILDAENQAYYLVMEYMSGGTIAEWDGARQCYVNARGPSSASKGTSLLDIKTVRTYVTNLVLAIQGLHLNHVAHRDIKPENLMANDDYTLCKLGDLGVAHYFKEENGELQEEENVEELELEDSNQTLRSSCLQGGENCKSKKRPLRGMIKSTKGTYQFLPPESLNGDAFCAFKADIWAIGVTMYALLFGYLPFYSSEVTDLFDKIENEPLTFPDSCNDTEVKDLLTGMLTKDPEQRISLENILKHRWTHRNVDSTKLWKKVSALKQTSVVCIEDHELESAVSVHQSRFQQMAAAIRHHTLKVPLETVSPVVIEGEYTPHPVDTNETPLPRWLKPLRDVIAAQMHYEWCQTKALAGWKYGDVRDDARLIHPCMQPMGSLDDTARSRNLSSVDEIVKCVVALGVQVTYRRLRSLKEQTLFPLPVFRVHLSWEMMMLIELLAENSHEVWATKYTATGWRFGAMFDESAKTHPSLKPYMLLEEHEKALTREGVTSVLKSCIYLGCTFSISHRRNTDS